MNIHESVNQKKPLEKQASSALVVPGTPTALWRSKYKLCDLQSLKFRMEFRFDFSPVMRSRRVRAAAVEGFDRLGRPIRGGPEPGVGFRAGRRIGMPRNQVS